MIWPKWPKGQGNALTSCGQAKPRSRYLTRGLAEPGGKLPLFDRDGREIPKKTIEACIAHGWAEPWIANPMKPDWLVCRLTPAGYRALGHPGPK